MGISRLDSYVGTPRDPDRKKVVTGEIINWLQFMRETSLDLSESDYITKARERAKAKNTKVIEFKKKGARQQ